MSPLKSFTILQKIILILSIIIFIAPMIYLLATWSSIPEKIPTHFGASGEADAYGSKSSCFIIIIMYFFLDVLMLVSLFLPKIWNVPVKLTENNTMLVYHYCRSMLCSTLFFLNCLFTYMLLQSVRGNSLGGWFLPVSMASIFLPIIYYTVKMVRVPK